MSVRDCVEIRALLWDFLDGALGGVERNAVEVHLASCEACGRELASIERLWALLDADRVPPAPDLTQRILSRAAAERPMTTSRAAGPPARLRRLASVRGRWVRWAALAAAAGLLLAITLPLLLGRPSRTAPPRAVEEQVVRNTEPFPAELSFLESQLVDPDQISDIEWITYADFIESILDEEVQPGNT